MAGGAGNKGRHGKREEALGKKAQRVASRSEERGGVKRLQHGSRAEERELKSCLPRQAGMPGKPGR